MEIRKEKEFENEDDTIKGFLYQCSDEQGKCHYPNKMPEYIDIMAFGCPECESEQIRFLFDIDSWACDNCGRIINLDPELKVMVHDNKIWMKIDEFDYLVNTEEGWYPEEEHLQLRWCSEDGFYYLFGLEYFPDGYETEKDALEALEYLMD